MNLAEHALQQLAKAKKEVVKPKAPPKALRVMLDKKDLLEDIINRGGNVSTISKELGYAGCTVGKYLNIVLGEELVRQARDNALMASASGMRKGGGGGKAAGFNIG